MRGAAQVRVYDGEGAGARSVASAVEALRESFAGGVQVGTIGTQELLRGQWQTSCYLLVFPGGADLPYCRQLNGHANRLISEYVTKGGAYMGLCAGAYYACSRVEFEIGSRLEVIGDRELQFFGGTAQGSIIPGFEYNSERGAMGAAIDFLLPGGEACSLGAAAATCQDTPSSRTAESAWGFCQDYANGAPAFVAQGSSHRSGDDALVIARYRDFGNLAAAVRCDVGDGVAVLCGTHPELHPHWLDDAADDDRHIQRLQESLKASQEKRLLFWRRLLMDANCLEFMAS